MDRLAKQFLEEDAANKELYVQGIIFKNDRVLDVLNQKFNDYLFRIKLYSYIRKSIVFAAMDIKTMESEIREKEGLYLNVLDADFEEERINTIADAPMDFIEEIYGDKENIDYREIFADKEVLQAIETLTDRQKQIIHECIIKDKEEEMVAKELGITKQAVNKIKQAALNKLRKEVGGK
ncbi:DNA-directed RNA polymerase specialized sigma subunit [Anaerosolibacter carboniphilus]|uniref:DNA-directed RNA polymerase specialized sigma subunit n=1 Tax=Anaerosolibacter carboniphilus TaxID=1417629 RepID=A0A841L499_9FIRM|nr:DNA-directed RNA polymerase specialized sigma subunit [Anaerosolibacter carboniphilus]